MRNIFERTTGFFQSYRFYIALLVGMSIVLYTLLRIAYPASFIYPDSDGYLLVAKAVRGWRADPNDWLRAPLTGFIFLLGTLFPERTIFPFIVAATLNIVALVLCFLYFADITKSAPKGFALTLLFFLWEWTMMRGPMYTLNLLSDGYFSSLLFLAILATLLALRKRHFFSLLFAAACFGCLVICRPNGFIFLVLWLPIFCIAYFRTHAQSRRSHFVMAPLVALLILFPGASWSFRHYTFYGTLKLSSIGEHNALANAIQFLKPEDTVFEDPDVHRRFHSIVQAIREEHGNALDSYLWMKPKNDLKLFDYLTTLTPTASRPDFRNDIQLYSLLRLELGPIVRDAAIQIIRAHPREFFRTWLTGYLSLFHTASHYGLFAPIDVLASNDDLRSWAHRTPVSHRRIFHQKEPLYSDVRYVLRTVPTILPRIRAFMSPHMMIGPVFWHGALLITLFLGWRYRGTERASIPITIAFLLLTAMINNATVALVQHPSERYALPGGAPLLMASILILYEFLCFLQRCLLRVHLPKILGLHLRQFVARDR